MKKRQESCSLLIHVALQDGLADCEMMNCEMIAGSGSLSRRHWHRARAAGGPSHITESTGESVQVCPWHSVHIIT